MPARDCGRWRDGASQPNRRVPAQLKAAGYIAVVNHGRWASYSLPPAWVGGTPAAGGQQTPLNGGTSLHDRGRPDLPDVAVHPHSEMKTRPSMAVYLHPQPKNGYDLTVHLNCGLQTIVSDPRIP